MSAPYILCTFDNMFWIVELKTLLRLYHLLSVYIVYLYKQISFLYIQTLHNDCSHIEDVHRRSRSRAEFGLVFFNFCYVLLFIYTHKFATHPRNVLMCCYVVVLLRFVRMIMCFIFFIFCYV